MSGIIKSIGYALFAAGVLATALYFWGAYLKGSDALNDALNPFTFRNYLAFAPLAPGAILLWLGDYIAARRRRHENR